MPQKTFLHRNSLILVLLAILIILLLIYVFAKSSTISKNSSQQATQNLNSTSSGLQQVVLRHKVNNNYDIIYTSNQAPFIERSGDWLFFGSYNETKVYAYNLKTFKKKTIFDPFDNLKDITDIYHLWSLDIASNNLFIQYQSSSNGKIRTFWVHLPIAGKFQELTKATDTYLAYENDHWWLKSENTESEAHYFSEYQTFDPANFKPGPNITFANGLSTPNYRLGFTADNQLLGTDIVFLPNTEGVYIYQHYLNLYTVNPLTATRKMLIDTTNFPKNIVSVEYSQSYHKAILIGDSIYIYDLATNKMTTIDKNLQIQNIRIYTSTQINNLLCLYNSESEETVGEWTAIDLTNNQIANSETCSDPNALNALQPTLADKIKQLNDKLKLPSNIEVKIIP